VIESVGEGVTDRTVGQRVALGLDAPRGPERMGTYTTHYVLPADRTVVVPDAVDETVCGALWLAYLTAWGCLVWKHGMREGDVVLIPAASSAVGLTASQVVKEHGGVAIGTTTSPEKVEHLRAMPEAMFDHIVCTAGSDTDPDEWRREVKDLSGGHGVDIAFDPVAAGAFLSAEIRALAEGGTIHVYGLLGKPGPVDVTPLIMKRGAIRGYLNMELVDAGADALDAGYAHVLARIADRRYVLPVARTFALSDVRDAHEYMEKGRHIGKLILVP